MLCFRPWQPNISFWAISQGEFRVNSKILLIINKISLVSFPGADYEVILWRTGEWIKGT